MPLFSIHCARFYGCELFIFSKSYMLQVYDSGKYHILSELLISESYRNIKTIRDSITICDTIDKYGICFLIDLYSICVQL